MNKHRIALIVALVVQFAPTPTAHAWIFPEHARLTELELRNHLQPEARAVFERVIKAIQDNPTTKLAGLCPDLIVNIVNLQERACVPFSALPALAGDHAVDEAGLDEVLLAHTHRVRVPPQPGKPNAWRVVTDEPLAFITHEVASRLAAYLVDAPHDVKSLYYDAHAIGGRDGEADDDARRMFIRKLDLYLDRHDGEYTTRAQGCRAHFQDASETIEGLIAQATAGNLDNALAQTLAHHLRSLQLAMLAQQQPHASQRLQLQKRALLEHAFALHFIQDAFAAGHIGTEHSIAGSFDRLRRHDYLNRVGLPITRSTAQYGCNPATSEMRDAADGYCWIAYGDGYLDATNADKTSDAAAHLSMQLALALDPDFGASLLQQSRDAIEPPTTSPPSTTTHMVTGAITALDQASTAAAAPATTELGPHQVRYEGQFIVHEYPLHVSAGHILHVTLSSSDFDAYLSVRLQKGQRWLAPDVSVINPDAVLDVPVPQDGTLEIRVGSATPNHYGIYQLTTEERGPLSSRASAVGVPRLLMRAAELLEPRPRWMLSKRERVEREQWSVSERTAVAYQIVRGAMDALARLGELVHGELPPTHADGRAVGEFGRLPETIVGRPFVPCRPSERWAERPNPFCETLGASFRFGDIDASVIKPILAVWPGPTGSVRTIRGDDAFSVGIAAQTSFGAGLAAGVHPQVPMALAPFVSAGFALRFDRLIPGRLNREIFGVNLGLVPIAMMGMHRRSQDPAPEPRYVTGVFAEARMPLLVVLGSLITGTPWNVGNWDIGPTGTRLYMTLPSRVPGDKLELFAWDIEALNVKLKSGTASRTASIGSGSDVELRLRLGAFKPGILDPSFDPKTHWVPTFGVEIGTGYSFALSGTP